MIYVIGNGDSRRDINIQNLRKKGKVYGCNALYRDEEVDVLVSGDHNMQQEIYTSGYAKDHVCFFTFWNRLPAMIYQSAMDGFQSKKELHVFENARGSSDEFVMQGYSHAGHIYVCWLDPEGDMVQNFQDHYPLQPEGFTRELTSCSTGNMAVFMAAHDNPGEDVHIIGFDMKLSGDDLNSMYKGTKNYTFDEFDKVYLGPTNDLKIFRETKYEIWKLELKLVMAQFPDTKFIGVNVESDWLSPNPNVVVKFREGVAKAQKKD